MVIDNMIQNWPITESDIINAHIMFGPNISGTRVNTVQQNPDRVAMDYFILNRHILKLHKFVTLVEYLTFVNGTPLLITK